MVVDFFHDILKLIWNDPLGLYTTFAIYLSKICFVYGSVMVRLVQFYVNNGLSTKKYKKT